MAIAFDERGRCTSWRIAVIPARWKGPGCSGGCHRVAGGHDRDGRFDKRTDFAGDLTFPNGILPWDGGVFVTCAPDLLYFKDTNGDGIADERRVVLTVSTRPDAQLRFSHPTLGIDNWVYLTSGLTGGRVTAPDHPERPPVVFGTSDTRFNPFTHAFELTGGQGHTA